MFQGNWGVRRNSLEAVLLLCGTRVVEREKQVTTYKGSRELFSGDTQVSVRPGAKRLSLKILRIFSDEICEFQRGWGELWRLC